MSYSVFKVEEFDDGKIIKITINRPKALNAMNPAFFEELDKIMDDIEKH